jgi:hypothetical protein
MVDTLNAHGGNATLLPLPTIGITGNTHFPMSDLNSAQVADVLSNWLREKGLSSNQLVPSINRRKLWQVQLDSYPAGSSY